MQSSVAEFVRGFRSAMACPSPGSPPDEFATSIRYTRSLRFETHGNINLSMSSAPTAPRSKVKISLPYQAKESMKRLARHVKATMKVPELLGSPISEDMKHQQEAPRYSHSRARRPGSPTGPPSCPTAQGYQGMVQTRQRPQRRENGCNGRQLSNLSNLYRHQRCYVRSPKLHLSSHAAAANIDQTFSTEETCHEMFVRVKSRKGATGKSAGWKAIRAPASTRSRATAMPLLRLSSHPTVRTSRRHRTIICQALECDRAVPTDIRRL